MEVWKKINEFPNYYISNKGNIRKGVNGKNLKTFVRNGYMSINLYNENECKQKYVHRLVGEAFIENPNNYPQINHKDENRCNNNVSNLEWCTCKYNINYGERTQKMLNSRTGPRKSIKVQVNNIVFDALYKAAKHIGVGSQLLKQKLDKNVKNLNGYIIQYYDETKN